MNLYEKLITFYPSLKDNDFDPDKGTIKLQNDGAEDYIKEWANANPEPTQAQLDEIK